MKRQIRGSVFETNSSSAHSIVIRNVGEHYSAKEIKEHTYINRNGEWDIFQYELEFGRSPFKYLATFVDKVRFCEEGWLTKAKNLLNLYGRRSAVLRHGHSRQEKRSCSLTLGPHISREGPQPRTQKDHPKSQVRLGSSLQKGSDTQPGDD